MAKVPSGIDGLDEVTEGGLPAGRPTLVCGGAGCGKSLFAMEFLVRGATDHGEPGVFVSFEEPIEDLAQNVASLGIDLHALVARKKIALDHVRIDRHEVEEAGEYDLEGLFIRLRYAIETVKAKRIVLDTIESLFAGLSNEAVLRSELRRLFHWLKDQRITAVITAERGDGALTRHGLEEYVSDCVILLDHRVIDQVATRRLRIVKYRGSLHGTNEYPFLIDRNGISVVPLSSVGLNHPASSQRVSSGIEGLDDMLGGKGFFRGSSILVTGTAGTGKSSIAASFAHAACARGERALLFAFEESANQLVRNMRSIGLDLRPWIDRGLLRLLTTRPTYYGLEMHLASMHKSTRDFDPQVVVIDPISNLISAGTQEDAQSMLLRLVDFLKSRGITAMFTSLTHSGSDDVDSSEMGVSSWMDSWVLLRDFESGGERNRGVNLIKSRGMKHSNQVREFLISSDGIQLRPPCVGESGVLTGSARLAEELRAQAREAASGEETRRRLAEFDLKRRGLEARIELLRAELAGEEQSLQNSERYEAERSRRSDRAVTALRASRGDSVDVEKTGAQRRRKRS